MVLFTHPDLADRSQLIIKGPAPILAPDGVQGGGGEASPKHTRFSKDTHSSPSSPEPALWGAAATRPSGPGAEASGRRPQRTHRVRITRGLGVASPRGLLEKAVGRARNS